MIEPKKNISSKPPVKDPVIQILRLDGNKLELSDGGETVTNGHNWVTWEIVTGEVEEIVGVYKKPASDEAFEDLPTRIHKGLWRGKTKNPGHDNIIEEYTIAYKKPGDPNTYYEDPIIQLNP